MKMKEALQKVVDRYTECFGLHPTIRDCITELLHIANENGLDTEIILDGANKVFKIERDEH